MEKNNYVVKANQFIEAKGRLGTLEQKLLATLISEIQLDDKDFKEYKFKISEVGEFIGLNSNAVYERLRETSINLKSKSLSLIEIDPVTKQRTFIEVSLIASAKHKEGSGELIITVAPDLKPYLLAIKGDETPFTKYMIKNILKLGNSYSIRLYEISKQWERTKKKEFELEELKELLGVEGDSYDRLDNFERRILKVAKDEINDKTDLWIDYEKIKRGRRIGSILFTIQSKSVADDQYIKYLDETCNITEIKNKSGLENEKFNSKQIIDLYEIAVNKTDDENVNPFEYIKINYLLMLEKKTVRSKFAYLKKALEEDYALAIGQIKLDTEI